jgi:hypothetical protein
MVMLCNKVSHIFYPRANTWPDLLVYLTRLFQDTGIILRFAIGKTLHGDAVQERLTYSFSHIKDLA